MQREHLEQLLLALLKSQHLCRLEYRVHRPFASFGINRANAFALIGKAIDGCWTRWTMGKRVG